ncbi:Detected protein of confused Function [Hibiscus syriacus]|uniref:Detected protein of confused Function n=1 Tax=Hibiscus syriacus TaxID=106335 RepID=A0A6A2YW38_HIBSY|nr:Detected protein of confused Function [Hibiscus syriacus]
MISVLSLDWIPKVKESLGSNGVTLTCRGINQSSGLGIFLRRVESKNEVFALYPLNAEFTRPLWVFEMNSYELIKSDAGKTLIACTYRQNGRSYLGILDDVQGSFYLLDIPFTDIENITSWNNYLYVEGASAVQPSSVAKVMLGGHKLNVVDFKIVWSSSLDCLKYESYFSRPELIEFPTEVPGQNAYAYYYPPKKIPFIKLARKKSHRCCWKFMVMEENFVNDFWGAGELSMLMTVAAVEDGKADKERLCITGGSAGGYTTLAALAFRDTFKAGASLYGVADLSLLRVEMHKFESQYIDKLVGDEKAYFERSPIKFCG